MRVDPMERMESLVALERTLWARGQRCAGIDEVGRGPLAGPVMAGCVVLTADALIPGVDDSKKLSAKRRAMLSPLIVEGARFVGVGSVSAADIDEIGIANATRRAMEMAARGAACDVFLVDAVPGLTLPGQIRSIVHGDSTSYLIAAASIVAKVARDAYMEELDAIYPCYGFAKHKGYGTAAHIAALREYGPCPEHRRCFIRGILGADA